MAEIQVKDYVHVPCAGCGASCVVSFLLPKIVIEAPKVCCTTECLKIYNKSREAKQELVTHD